MTDSNKSNPSHLGSSDYDDEPTLASHDAQPQYARHTFPYPINRRYRCLGLLGQGSSGAVYKAFDSQLQREVALKFIHQDQLAGVGSARAWRLASNAKRFMVNA